MCWGGGGFLYLGGEGHESKEQEHCCGTAGCPEEEEEKEEEEVSVPQQGDGISEYCSRNLTHSEKWGRTHFILLV